MCLLGGYDGSKEVRETTSLASSPPALRAPPFCNILLPHTSSPSPSSPSFSTASSLPAGTSAKRKLPSAVVRVAYLPPLRITLVGSGASLGARRTRPSKGRAWVEGRVARRRRRRQGRRSLGEKGRRKKEEAGLGQGPLLLLLLLAVGIVVVMVVALCCVLCVGVVLSGSSSSFHTIPS